MSRCALCRKMEGAGNTSTGFIKNFAHTEDPTLDNDPHDKFMSTYKSVNNEREYGIATRGQGKLLFDSCLLDSSPLHASASCCLHLVDVWRGVQGLVVDSDSLGVCARRCD